MDVTAITQSTPLVHVHLLCALCAVLIGPVALWRQRRDRLHKICGYAFVAAMAGLALSGFAIPSAVFAAIGPFGPIHVLCIVTLFGLWQGVTAARRGQITRHRAHMRGLYFGALLITGLFTVMPGRALNRALFPETPEFGWIFVTLGTLALIWALLAPRRNHPPTRVD
ncbi:MAG: DUF2306 domain-containing protein [Pseudomonadota bacterium]